MPGPENRIARDNDVTTPIGCDLKSLPGLRLLRLDAPPLNAISLEMLDSLREAVGRAAEEEGVRGIVIAGSGGQFSAGADINLFGQITWPDDARRISRIFQETFRAIEDSPLPVVAAMAGRAIGGAVELAAACHARVAARDARFSSPEVNLGFNPGAGATQRLPRLVGVEAALRMMLRAETVAADEALALGLLDAVCGEAELLQTARRLVEEMTEPRRTSLRTDKIADAAANETAFRAAEASLAQAHPEIIAPRKILEVVRTGLDESFEAGLAAEQDAFAKCLATRPAQNKIHLFFATRQTAKLPELAGVEPRPVNRVAVIGMGTMGTGIVQALATAGLEVAVLDENAPALERGTGRIRDSLEKRVADGKLDPARADATLARIRTTSDWGGLGPFDLAVETVFEDATVKQAVLGKLEQIAPADAVLATNTSTITLADLAAGLGRPERLVGLHFFNPAHRMPLVEVIRREGTPPEVLATAVALARRLRKTPVVVQSREGFLVNRVFIPYLQEAFGLLEEGAEPRAIDDAMLRFGFPMGPMVLIDMAGLDILVDAQAVLARAFPWHGPLSAVALRLVDAGQLGQKSGSGVWRYEPGDRTPQPSPVTAGIVAEVRRESGRPPHPVAPEEITERLVLRMAAEAYRVLDEGLVAGAADVDVATVLGVGFPDFRGGLVRYADDLGRAEVARRLAALAERHGERFSPSAMLRG